MADEWIDDDEEDSDDIALPGWRTSDADTLAEHFDRVVSNLLDEGYSRFAVVTAMLAVATEQQWKLQFDPF